jgi:type I restriction enzyme, S subunit
MTTNLFVSHFETIADAPGGIARLRQLILQLAVQGRLVAQNPTDEPVSVVCWSRYEQRKRDL